MAAIMKYLIWEGIDPSLDWARAPLEAMVRGLCRPSFRFQVSQKTKMHPDGIQSPQCSFEFRIESPSSDTIETIHIYSTTKDFVIRASWGSREKTTYLRRCNRSELPAMRKLGVDLACRLSRRQLPLMAATVLAE